MTLEQKLRELISMCSLREWDKLSVRTVCYVRNCYDEVDMACELLLCRSLVAVSRVIISDECLRQRGKRGRRSSFLEFNVSASPVP